MNFLKGIVNSLKNFVIESAHADLIAAIGTPESAVTPEEAFLVEALVLIMRNQGNTQVVYPFLLTNIDMLNDRFLEWLPTWMSAKLSAATTTQKMRIAAAISTFSTVLQEFPFGDKAINLEIAITGYDLSKMVKQREIFPGPWAEVEHNLGVAYCYRVRGDRGENLEIAIACCESALEVRTRESRPQQWATTQGHLGIIYRNRLLGDPPENLEQAITCYKNALQILSYETRPKDWAKMLHNLAIALSFRIRGDHVQNLEEAIACCQQVLQPSIREYYPEAWAKNQLLLSSLYQTRLIGDPVENVEAAITCCQEGLQVCSPETFPQLWAKLKSELGNAYSNRFYVRSSERKTNLDKALESFEEALQILTRENAPQLWANTQIDLATIYRDEIWGNHEQAIHCFEKALDVYNREAFPQQWARVQNEVLTTFVVNSVHCANKQEKIRYLIEGVACGQAALEVLTQKIYPQEWALVNSNLAGAYANLLSCGQVQYVQAAITSAENALQVYTRETSLRSYIQALFYLGSAYQSAGQLHHAYQNLATALETSEFLRYEGLKSDLSRQKWAFQWKDLYKKIVDVCLELAVSEPHYYDKALEYLEYNKARVLVKALATHKIIPSGIPETLCQELQHLQQEILIEERRLEMTERAIANRKTIPDETSFTQSSGLPAYTRDYSHLIRLQQQLNDVITNKIQPLNPEFGLTQRVESISFAQIQSLVDKNTVILEWYITSEQIKVFIVTSQNQHPLIHECPINWRDFPLEEMEALIPGRQIHYFSYLKEQSLSNPSVNFPNLLEEYLRYIYDYSQNRKQWRENLSEQLQRFAQLLDLDRVVTKLPETCNQVILIPHFVLHIFPLHALPLKNGSYLIDRFPGGVRYSPSCQALQLTKSQERLNFSSHLFAVQNPTQDLSYSDLEVAAIRQNFSPNDDILVQKDARKTEIYPLRIQNAQYIHFSCHGFFNFENPLQSALLLADAFVAQDPAPLGLDEQQNAHFADSPTSENTLRLQTGEIIDLSKCLTLPEIFTFDLSQCRLVTLSACETGLIDTTTSSDEYIGLPNGFLYAGSPSVVSSLWIVNDISTTFLMIKFYENLQRQTSVAVALNQAQVWLRNATGAELEQWMEEKQLPMNGTLKISIKRRFRQETRPFQEPFHWAAFCAIGQ
ncbi:CHAT domain-containing protein [Aetokthonos hydrillicola]|nr:CHAT domain-containing protein [Aetokthonos hydrillicola]MBO3460150.1 CHAT domain-containing protein [Aetokthonos hydrillicola CCALA 1050]MBW4590477.1 CHAT domain-containing protein [Aetokthonos hydrillicola CCALA 1050]